MAKDYKEYKTVKAKVEFHDPLTGAVKQGEFDAKLTETVDGILKLTLTQNGSAFLVATFEEKL